MTILEITLPVPTDQRVLAIWNAHSRFEISLTAGKAETHRAPLWIPRLPRGVGDVVRASQPSYISPTGRLWRGWRIDGANIWADGVLVDRALPNQDVRAYQGDTIMVDVQLRGG